MVKCAPYKLRFFLPPHNTRQVYITWLTDVISAAKAAVWTEHPSQHSGSWALRAPKDKNADGCLICRSVRVVHHSATKALKVCTKCMKAGQSRQSGSKLAKSLFRTLMARMGEIIEALRAICLSINTRSVWKLIILYAPVISQPNPMPPPEILSQKPLVPAKPSKQANYLATSEISLAIRFRIGP